MSVEEIEDFLGGKYKNKSVEDVMEDFGCPTNTDNPFRVFLRMNNAGLLINNTAGRSLPYNRLPYNRLPSIDEQEDKVPVQSSVDSSENSSGSC